MELPEGLIRGQIEEGKVYRFYDIVPEDSDAVPGHWHICVKVHDEIVYLVCCTTKENTIDKFIRVNGLDCKTKVAITPSEDNGLNRETFINCNSVYFCDFEELVAAIHDGRVRYGGQIVDSDFRRIVVGILSSAVIEPFIKELLIAPKEK